MTLLQRDRENLESGREEGRNQMAALVKILLSENCIEDLYCALEDAAFRNELLELYDICNL